MMRVTSTQKLPMVVRRVPRDAAHERAGDGDADGGGEKVVDGQRDHLREIRHRGFAAVALPVGVGGEADGGVERQMLRQRAELLRIERQKLLQPQNRVGEQAAHEAEQQHRERVLLPVVFLRRVHAQHAVSQFFQRAQDRVEPGAAVGVEHAVDIQAERLGDQHERGDIQRQFQPLMGSSWQWLKFFRFEHGDDEIHAQRHGNDSEDEIFHRINQSFSQPRAYSNKAMNTPQVNPI